MFRRRIRSTIVAAASCLMAFLTGVGCVPDMPPMKEIPKDSVPVVRQAIHRLYSISAQYRAQGCLDLGMMGEKASPAVPFLIPLLADETMAWSPSVFIPYIGRAVSGEASDALVLIGRSAVDLLAAAMKHRNPAMRAGAACCLRRIKDPRAVNSLLSALDDPDASVRVAAARALWAITSDKSKSLPVLLANCGMDARESTREAIEGIEEMGPGAAEAVPLLIEVLQAGHYRLFAVSALGRIGPAAKDAVPALRKALHSEEVGAVGPVVRALGDIGPAAASTIPDLLEAAKRLPDVEGDITSAIRRIQGLPE